MDRLGLCLVDCGVGAGTVSSWYERFRQALVSHTTAAPLDSADVVVIDADPMVPHFPGFLEAVCTHPRGRDGFFEARERLWSKLWYEVVPRLLPRLSSTQRLLVCARDRNTSLAGSAATLQIWCVDADV
jgi:hypothetical protein